MDQSLWKLLKDDEDEIMHSWNDVEMLQTALYLDIDGDAFTGSNNSFSKSLPMWPTSSHEIELKQQGSVVEQIQNVASQDASNLTLSHKQSQDECLQRQTVPVFNNEPIKTNNPNCESQYAKLQQMSNQQATVSEQPSSQINRRKLVPFGLLLPIIFHQLAEDKAVELLTLLDKLRRDEIPRDNFVRLVKGVVGEQILRSALTEVQQLIEFNTRTFGQQHPVRMPTVTSSPPQTGIFNPFLGTISGSLSSLRPQTHPYDSHIRRIPHQGIGLNHLGVERQSSFNNPKRMRCESVSTVVNNTTSQQTSNSWQPSAEQKQGLFSSVSYVKEPNRLSIEKQYRHQLYLWHRLPYVSSAQIAQGTGVNQGSVKDQMIPIGAEVIEVPADEVEGEQEGQDSPPEQQAKQKEPAAPEGMGQAVLYQILDVFDVIRTDFRRLERTVTVRLGAVDGRLKDLEEAVTQIPREIRSEST